ncbi:transcription termination/antitermination protein NusG [Ochrobactrum sp. EDr1-4]|uniref:transcription termination/antitermination protein NusG n=1 Tax=Ochrobactrum sp. EDr1-4 TaxID=3368622 RepID=UPI003BA33369
MMAIDQRQIDIAIASAPSEEHCRAIDKVLAERRRIERLRATAAVRMQDDSPWLILRTRVNREVSVCEALEVTNIEALVPMKMGPKLRRQKREIPPRKAPVMVGYMLARCPINNDAIAALLSFDDVSEVLGGYQNPYLMSAEKVRCFNEKAKSGEFDHERPVTLFGHLRKVQIVEGPFAGHVGAVVTSVGKGKGTAVVEIQFMNRPMPMIVPLAFLSPL